MQDKLLAQHCIPSVLSTRASCDLSKYPREEWTVAQSLSPFPVTLRDNRPTGLVSACVSSPVPPARCCARLCLTLVAPASLGCWWQPPSSVPRPPYRLQGKRRVGLVPQTQRKGPGTPPLPGAVGPRSGGTGPPGTFRGKAQLWRGRVNVCVCATTDALSLNVGHEHSDTTALPQLR